MLTQQNPRSYGRGFCLTSVKNTLYSVFINRYEVFTICKLRYNVFVAIISKLPLVIGVVLGNGNCPCDNNLDHWHKQFMENKNFHINDQSNDKMYFTILPNMLIDTLSSSHIHTYLIMKRLAGETARAVWISKRYIKEKLKIGHDKVNTILNDLVSMGYIEFKGVHETEIKGVKQHVEYYTIKNIWDMNMAHFRGDPMQDSGGAPVQNHPLSHTEQGVLPHGTLVRTTTKNPTNNKQVFITKGDDPLVENPQSPVARVAKQAVSKKAKMLNSPYEESFETFWAIYPEKVGKGKAYEVWQLLEKPIKQKCIDAITEQVEKNHFYKYWLKRNSVPHPTTWLNQRRWEDVVKDNNKSDASRDPKYKKLTVHTA